MSNGTTPDATNSRTIAALLVMVTGFFGLELSEGEREMISQQTASAIQSILVAGGAAAAAYYRLNPKA